MLYVRKLSEILSLNFRSNVIKVIVYIIILQILFILICRIVIFNGWTIVFNTF